MTTDTTAGIDFANTLFKATLGNSDAIGEIIRMYLPLIDHLQKISLGPTFCAYFVVG